MGKIIWTIRLMLDGPELYEALRDIVEFADKQNKEMNGKPPTYKDSRSPTGDDWNELDSEIQFRIRDHHRYFGRGR